MWPLGMAVRVTHPALEQFDIALIPRAPAKSGVSQENGGRS